MRIKVLSDVHLEFHQDKQPHPISPGEGDVLILAGDILRSCDIGTGNDLDEVYQTFLEDCVRGYNKVFYTLGNHEYYEGVWETTEERIRNNLPEGISLLNNQSEFYNGIHFIGSTLWADFRNSSPLVMDYASRNMNDYRCITKKDGRRLSALDTLKAHDESISWLSQVLPMLRGKIIIFSHHAPSFLSNRGGYREIEAAPAYCTDLSKLIEQYPNIDYWFHGHLHQSVNYDIGNTTIMSNPFGYHGYSINESFDPKFYVNV